MKRLLCHFVISDRLFCFATSEFLPLSGRETGISAFFVLGHFIFALSPRRVLLRDILSRLARLLTATTDRFNFTETR